MSTLSFHEAEKKDLDKILDLYNFYISTTTVTFDWSPISEEQFRNRVFIGHDKYQTYIIHFLDEQIGFCFFKQYRNKEAYDHTAEIGIYLKPGYTGKGVGKETVIFLEQAAISKGIKVVIASISNENVTCIKLFEKMGYDRCAHYKQIGEKFGRFLDIVDFQKILSL